MVKSTLRTVIAVLLLALLAACGGNSVAKKQGIKLNIGDIEQSAGSPKLQVIITHNETRSTHSALRLEHPKRGTLFWDPGGVYGKVTDRDRYGWTPHLVGRKNDLIQAHAPSLPTYWTFAVRTHDSAMEILEWELTEQRGDELHQILLSGAQDGGRPDGFTTDSAPFFCSLALSDFLKQFGRGIATADQSYFWPSDLANHLRAQHPHRVLVFSSDEPKVIYASTHPPTQSVGSKNHGISLQGIAP